MKIRRYFLLLAVCSFLFTRVSAQTILSGNYTGTLTLTKAASPYLVMDSAVFNCSPLTIEPGVIITFKVQQDPAKKSFIRMKGSLNFTSSAVTDPIIFTSERDNQPYDLNGDSTASRPAAGDWGFVIVDPSIQETGIPDFKEDYSLKNVDFRYGGGRNPGMETNPEKYPMVMVTDYNQSGRYEYRIAFSACSFSYSAGVGVQGGMAELSNSLVHNCTYGIRAITSDFLITNSEIRDNRIYPIYITDPLIKRDDTDDFNSVIEDYYGNQVYNNGQNVIAIEGTIRCAYDENTAATLKTTQLRNMHLPYLVTGDLIVDSLILDIDAGTLIKFLPGIYTGTPLNIRLINSAELRTNGTENEKVVFTSMHDYKYDKVLPTNQDLQPVAGDWGIISGKNPQITQTIFKYGGKYVSAADGRIVPDSSAVLHITEADSEASYIRSAIFTDLFNNGIFVSEPAVTGGNTLINDNSFFLDRKSYGIITAAGQVQGDSLVNGTNNYWNGKLGPYHPSLNKSGNGCLVSNRVDFSGYQASTSDTLDLLNSVIRGLVKNDQEEILGNAFIRLDSKEPRITYTDFLGRFSFVDVPPGDGYQLEVLAKAHYGAQIAPLNIPLDTSLIVNIALEKYTIDYALDTINFNINPERSVVSVGGTAHRYYRIIDINTREPVYGAEVLVPPADTFYSNSKGIVDIAIPSWRVGAANATSTFSIQRIGLETLDFPENERETFDVHVTPFSYRKVWSGSTYFTVGVAGFEGTKLRGAALDLQVKDNGAGEYADSVRFARQTKTGFGYNLGASAKVSAGPVEGGAEAGVGINLNVLFEDDFNFDYQNANGRVALSKFIVLADGALPYMDAPLIRYFTVALEKQMSEIEAAAISNSIGMNIHAYASANAGLDLDLLEGDKGTIGAELKGSASASGDHTYMARVHAHKHPVTGDYPLDLSYDFAAEIELGATAGIGFDLEKLFKGKEKNHSDKNGTNVKKVDSKLPFPVPDEDFGFDLASVHASGGIKYGLQFGTTRFVPYPYCNLGFMYGYKYSYGAEAIFVGEKSNSQNREFRYTFDFYDEKMVEMVKETADLAKSMMSPDNLIELKVSDLTSGKIFNNPMNTIAYQQSRNSFTVAPVPYHKTITDQVGQGGFNILIDVGAAVVRGKFGAGFKYAEKNKYFKETGVFYKWDLYALESYDFLTENETFEARPIVQEIVSTSAAYLVDQIRLNLRPPIFRKIPIWPFNSKASGAHIPIGPPSRTSNIFFADSTTITTIQGIDSLDVVYWDWYGTGDDEKSSKKAAAAQKLALFEYVKKSAKEVHKLDYGIGGFYQFEPYNTSVGDNEVYVEINYFDDELTVMLADSSISMIREKDLRMYKEDKENNRWDFIGGMVDTVNNTVLARIDSFGTFTLAPFIPSGEFNLSALPDTIQLEVTNSTTVTSGQIFYNTGELIGDGELFTVRASRGSFPGTDADTSRAGFQVAAESGKFDLVYEANSLSGEVMLLVESLQGDAYGELTIFVADSTAPGQPVLAGAEMQEETVHLWWKMNEEADIVKYLVHYDTVSGGPYQGVASVFGEPSPVDAGLDSTINVAGLTRGMTYYFAVSTVDRSGNMSPFSNELSLFTEVNHRPVFYHTVIHIDPDLPEGTVIDTLRAEDEDEGQELTFYFADTTTENAFAVDPQTGILTVNNEVRLNYFVTRIDTFLLGVSVTDDALNPSTDEGLVMVVLDVETWVPEYPAGQVSVLEVYPNPAAHQITFKLGDPGYSGETALEIYSIDGKRCYSEVFFNVTGAELTIPVHFLENGFYTAVVRSNNANRSGSFVIQR